MGARQDFDPLPLEDLGLAVKWQVVTELGYDDRGDEQFRGQPAGHDMLGRILELFIRKGRHKHGHLGVDRLFDQLACAIADSRQGIDLDRSTLAGWVGKAAYELRPVFDALIADLKQSTKLFMDKTRAPVLDPGKRKTKTGYFWALSRDDSPWAGAAPPRVASTYAPGRSGQYADDILKGNGTHIAQQDGSQNPLAVTQIVTQAQNSITDASINSL
jgi:hypothetical protein